MIHTEAMEYSAADRLPLFGSLSGGQAITATWCALLNGATLCPFAVTVKGLTGLADWMSVHGITVYASSASIFRSFMKALDDGFKFPGVRAVRLSSEPATSDDFKLFQRHFLKHSVFVHTLSCSETCNIAWSRRSHDDSVPEGRLPIGMPSKGQTVLLWDHSDCAVAPGEVGEIVVRSRYVAAGYWRDGVLTADRFSDDLDGAGTRLVRTGDLGRINTDGMLEFRGRRDDRVKIRGNRIELSEVEAALHRVGGIERAVVEAIPRDNKEPVLVGFIVLRGDRAWRHRELRSELLKALPSAMVPSAFVFLDRFPITPTGKIDREKLRQRNISWREPRSDQEPRTETDALLAGIWAEVFERDDIGLNDDFFNLGGDSLMAAVVAARLWDAVGVEVHLGTFVRHPTLKELARTIDRLQGALLDDPQPLLRSPRNGPLPLTFWQERMWRFSQTAEQSAGYTVARVHRILGPLDVGVLRDCLDYIAGRHEILHTTFALIDGRPAQIVHPPTPVRFHDLDLTGASDPEGQAKLYCKQEAARIFDLTQGPLMRISLIRLRKNEYWLLRVAHHIITDTNTWLLYFRELALLYETKLAGKPAPLPEIAPLQYGDYAIWHQQVFALDAPAYRKSVEWWHGVLAAAPENLKLPFQRPRASTDVAPAEGVMYWGIAPDISRRLDALGQSEGATPYMVRLAIFVSLIAAETGEPDVILGTYLANRNRVAVQNMFGPFINLATFRFRYEPHTTFLDWLSIVRERVADTELHSEIPYEELCDELHRMQVMPPAIQILFGISKSQHTIKFADLELTPLRRYEERMPWGFTVNHDEEDEKNECRVAFDARLYSPAGVRAFVERYTRLLDTASRHPDRALVELLAMSPASKLAGEIAPRCG